MAKKSKAKKHRFKYAETGGSSDAQVMPSETTNSSANVGSVAGAGAKGAKTGSLFAERNFSYVARDVRRLTVYALSLIGLQLLLSYLFNNTGLGPTIYDLIRV